MPSLLYRREPRLSSVGRVLTEVPVVLHDVGATEALRAAVLAGVSKSAMGDVPAVLDALSDAGWVLVRRSAAPVEGGAR